MEAQQYERIYCNESGCTAHDYEIRAYKRTDGTFNLTECVYLDHLRAKEVAQTATKDVGEVVQTVLENILPPLMEAIENGRSWRPPVKASPPPREEQRRGGVPL